MCPWYGLKDHQSMFIIAGFAKLSFIVIVPISVSRIIILKLWFRQKRCKPFKLNWTNYICLVQLLMYFLLSVECYRLKLEKTATVDGNNVYSITVPTTGIMQTMFDSGLLFQTGLPHNSWIQLCGCTCWSLSLLFKVSIPIVTHCFKSRQPTAQWGRLLTAEVAAVAGNNLMLSWLSVMRFSLFI